MLKKKFLELSIDKQIQVGIVSVSFIACVFILLSILLNTTILIILAYYDVSSILDRKESQQIEGIGFYLDGDINTMVELAKIQTQWVRNFIQNTKRNPDFINNLVNLDYTKNMKNLDSLNNLNTCSGNTFYYTYQNTNNTINNTLSNCMFYKILYPINTANTQSFTNLLSIMAATIPLIQRLFIYRYNENANLQIFGKFTFQSAPFQTVFTYSPEVTSSSIISSIFYTNYSSTDLAISMQRASYTCAYGYYYLTIPSIVIPNIFDVNATLSRNPFIQFISPLETYQFPYNNAFTQHGVLSAVASISSILYGNGIQGTFNNLYNSSNIIDVVNSDFSTSLIDQISFTKVKKFQGFKILGTALGTYELFTVTACQYFLKFWQIQNNLNITLDSPRTLWDCAKSLPVKNILLNYFNTTNQDIDITKKMKRKISVNLINDYYNRGILYDTFFKIYRMYSPDVVTSIVFNSAFFTNYSSYLFVFKNTKYLLKSISILFNKFFGLITMIMFYNFVIWYVCFGFIIIVVFIVSLQITRPIKQLIVQVTNYGRGDAVVKGDETPEEKNKYLQEQRAALEKIHYHDDDDINDLFQICKSLLKGGFTEDSGFNMDKKNKSQNIANAYNNIAYIKSNNLIINEDLIENNITNLQSIFSYVAKSDVNKDDEVKIKESDVEIEMEIINKEVRNDHEFLMNFHTNDKESDIIEVKDFNIPENFLSNIKSKKTIKNALSVSARRKLTNLEIIFNIVQEEENKMDITAKSYLFGLFTKITNNGTDLKILNIDKYDKK